METRPRRAVFLAVSAGLLLVSAIAALRFGALQMSASGVLHALLCSDNSANAIVIRSLRLPRVLLAGAVGASLAAAGALLQGLTRNPLASPEIFGVVGGTELGAAIAIYVFRVQATGWIVVWGLLGGAAVLGTIFLVARAVATGDHFTTLAISGVTVGVLAEGLVALVMKWHEGELADIERWAEASIGGRDPAVLRALWPAMVIAGVAAIALAQRLNVLSLGEEAATALGERHRAVQAVGLFAALLLTATAVTAAGPIGFIGLVIPHLARLCGGADYRSVVPGSLLLGAAALILADLLARTVFAHTFAGTQDELPITAVTAFFGAPVFLLILRSRLVRA